MVERLGMHRAHPANVVGAGRQVRPEVGELHAALAVLVEATRTAHEPRRLALNERKTHVARHRLRQRLAVQLVQLRLGVPKVDLAGSALHVHVDDALGPRPEGGATSDHFTDLENLTFEPHFEEYVKESFNPVGLMLDFWAEKVKAGGSVPLKAYVINDLYGDWQGNVRVRILKGDKEVWSQSKSCKVAALGRGIPEFTVEFPTEPGPYVIQAEVKDGTGKTIRSLRDFGVF